VFIERHLDGEKLSYRRHPNLVAIRNIGTGGVGKRCLGCGDDEIREGKGGKDHKIEHCEDC